MHTHIIFFDTGIILIGTENYRFCLNRLHALIDILQYFNSLFHFFHLYYIFVNIFFNY
jgi:hypothetical protein